MGHEGEDDEEKARGRWGRNSDQEDYERRSNGNGRHFNSFRPLENLRHTSVLEMEDSEREPVVEALHSMLVDAEVDLADRMETSIENFDYTTLTYTLQRDQEQSRVAVKQLETLRMVSPDAGNERLLGLVEREARRISAAETVFKWAAVYKAKYFSGLESMALLAERGQQLALSNLDRLLRGIRIKWLDNVPEPPKPDLATYEPMSQERAKYEKTMDAGELLPLKENGETVTDRYAKYTGDADFWFRVTGEMNTHDPTIPGSELQITRTMQTFLADMLIRRPRNREDGEPEVIKEDEKTRKITVWLDANGEQLPQRPDGTLVDPTQAATATKREAYINILDYYNKAKSEDDYRWVVSVISALAMTDAKSILDQLPENMEPPPFGPLEENDQNGSNYRNLFNAVQKIAQEMMDNYDIPPTEDMNHMLAKSGVHMADAIAFGTFDIAERGFNNEWKRKLCNSDGKTVDKDGEPIKLPRGYTIGKDGVIFDDKGNPSSEFGYIWEGEPGQGNPTASGDAFTAARIYFHEVVYQAIKNRISANNSGVLLPIDHKRALEMAKVYSSEIAEANQREKTIKLIAEGHQQHLAKYFGVLGAFEAELGHLPMWQEGNKLRESLGKKINPNFSKAVEDLVVFVPTPFNFSKSEKSAGQPEFIKKFGLAAEDSILFPMIAHQFKIGLYNMLSTTKEITVADMLQKTWIKDTDGKWVEATLEQGGRRLTIRDINFMAYGRYDEDSRAVNNNFMLQLYSPLYGALNEKAIKAAKQNIAPVFTAAVKAADIGLRWVIQKLKHPTPESGPTIKRPTLEIMHASAIAFQQLALGAYGIIGEGAVGKYYGFVDEILGGKDREEHADNLYNAERQIEDFIPEKQGYPHYADSFYSSMLAQTFALEPIAIASDDMAEATTTRFRNTYIKSVRDPFATTKSKMSR